MTRKETTVLVIDPPDNPDIEGHLEKPERIGKCEWRVRDDVAFSQPTRLISQAKILSFAGADEAAQQMIERAGTRVFGGPRTRPRQTSPSLNPLYEYNELR